eukprot:6198152-Pleurochrysis_carterae.AAC.1
MFASSEKYTDEQLQEASGWLQAISEGAVRPPPSLVDASALNEAQGFEAIFWGEVFGDSTHRGGCRQRRRYTYHSQLPMPFSEIDRADFTPGPARLKALQLKFRGVSH